MRQRHSFATTRPAADSLGADAEAGQAAQRVTSALRQATERGDSLRVARAQYEMAQLRKRSGHALDASWLIGQSMREFARARAHKDFAAASLRMAAIAFERGYYSACLTLIDAALASGSIAAKQRHLGQMLQARVMLRIGNYDEAAAALTPLVQLHEIGLRCSTASAEASSALLEVVFAAYALGVPCVATIYPRPSSLRPPIDHLTAALALIEHVEKQLPSWKVRVKCSLLRALIHALSSNADLSQSAIADAHGMVSRLPVGYGRFVSLVKGSCARLLHDPASGIRDLLDAVSLAVEYDDAELKRMALYEIGLSYKSLGNTAAAIDSFTGFATASADISFRLNPRVSPPTWLKAVEALSPPAVFESNSTNKEPVVMQDAYRLISSEIATITIPVLAGKLGLSRRTLEAHFRRWRATSPADFIRDCRLSAAAGRLRTTSVQISDLAKELGFSSAAFFSRQFSRRYGVSPLHYRAAGLPKEVS